jgi:DNA polymerase III subunit chi
MTERIDFYVLASTAPEQRRRLACRLAARAYLDRGRVILWSGSEAEAQACDDLLWTFDDRAFVPHRISRDAELADRGTPVHVAVAPEGLPRFARVAEIIDADESRRRLGRERFRAYREQKLPLETRQCRDSEDL